LPTSLRPRTKVWCYAATGPTPVRVALSSIAAPLARSDGSPDGSTRPCLRLCRRLDHHPEKMTVRRSTAEHPFGTIKSWMGATHFLTKRLPKVSTEMSLNVLAYNMKRAMAIIGVAGLLEAMVA